MGKNLNIKISIKYGSDILTALGECIKIAQAIDDTVCLSAEGVDSMSIHKDSNVIDLLEIYRMKLEKFKEIKLYKKGVNYEM